MDIKPSDCARASYSLLQETADAAIGSPALPAYSIADRSVERGGCLACLSRHWNDQAEWQNRVEEM